VPLIIILWSVGTTGYLIVTNAIKYGQYQKRDLYVLHRVANTTSHYYIIRGTLIDTSNCSSDALFPFDVTTVYKNIISKEGKQNVLFVTVYWSTMVVAVIANLCGIIWSILDYCCIKSSTTKSDIPFIINLILCIWSQLLCKGAFIFPTYFIGIFDYSQLCLSHHTTASLFILHHTYIGIFVSLGAMLYFILWTFCCWQARTHNYDEEKTLVLQCLNTLLPDSCLGPCICIFLLIILCLAAIAAGIYGFFVWGTSLVEVVLTSKAILIGFNFFLGMIHPLTRHCKH
jgi:hypothetical protein